MAGLLTFVLLLGPASSALAGDEREQSQPWAAPFPSPMAQPMPYAAYPPPATTFAPNPNGATAAADPSPFYDHWPFWVVFTAAVAGGVVAGVLWARQTTDLAMPTTTFGTKRY